jgi:hypothetical protein
MAAELFQKLLLASKNVSLVVNSVALQAAKTAFPLLPASKFLSTCNFTPTLRTDIALPELKQILFFRFIHNLDFTESHDYRSVSMEAKDVIALLAITATFAVALINFVYNLVHNRRAAFVNTVTASRLKWIDSLRDKVASFIAVTVRIADSEKTQNGNQDLNALLRDRDTLNHQIILHLNPNDPEDQAIQGEVESIVALTKIGEYSDQLKEHLAALRTATQKYLKKEWNRVKSESKTGEQN